MALTIPNTKRQSNLHSFSERRLGYHGAQASHPDVVVVNGTRIIAEKVLHSVPATFLNTHSGITPLYRGAHGGYWALVKKDRANCGVTIHVVDAGIDTGGIVTKPASSQAAPTTL